VFSHVWSLAAGLSGPIFQGGQILENYRANIAAWEQAKLQYEQAVITAFQEVSSALTAVLCKNSILIALDIVSPNSDNRQKQPPVLQRDPLAMRPCTRLLHHFIPLASTLLVLLGDVVRFLLLCLRPSPALAAENLFLRKQLALYRERGVTPKRASNATRSTLACLAHWFDWRQALAVVQPATLIRWHRQGFRLCW
jgi:hypothetical protein